MRSLNIRAELILDLLIMNNLRNLKNGIMLTEITNSKLNNCDNYIFLDYRKEDRNTFIEEATYDGA